MLARMVAMARGVTVLLCSFPVAAAIGCSPYGQACNGECSASSSVVSDSSAVTDSDGDTAASDGDTAATDGDTDGYSGWLGAPCMSEEDEQAEAGKPLVHFDIDAGRVDVRADAGGALMVLEVNPLPGMHPEHSDLPILASKLGISYVELMRRILDHGLARIAREPLPARATRERSRGAIARCTS